MRIHRLVTLAVILSCGCTSETQEVVTGSPELLGYIGWDAHDRVLTLGADLVCGVGETTVCTKDGGQPYPTVSSTGHNAFLLVSYFIGPRYDRKGRRVVTSPYDRSLVVIGPNEVAPLPRTTYSIAGGMPEKIKIVYFVDETERSSIGEWAGTLEIELVRTEDGSYQQIE